MYSESDRVVRRDVMPFKLKMQEETRQAFRKGRGKQDKHFLAIVRSKEGKWGHATFR